MFAPIAEIEWQDVNGREGVALTSRREGLLEHAPGAWIKGLTIRRKAEHAREPVIEPLDERWDTSKIGFNMTSTPGEDALDGVKVDQQGNVYVSGPGGLWVLSAEGKHLGTIVLPKHPHNFAWGEDNGKTLYLCARDGLYLMKLNVSGVRS